MPEETPQNTTATCVHVLASVRCLLSVGLCECPSACLSARLVCLCVCLLVCLYDCLYVCLSARLCVIVHLHVCLSVCVSYSSVRLSVWLTVYVSDYDLRLRICLSVMVLASRLEPIMLNIFMIMLCCTAHEMCQLCSKIYQLYSLLCSVKIDIYRLLAC